MTACISFRCHSPRKFRAYTCRRVWLLPLGPFRAYDRQGFLVSTIYMVPMKDLDSHKMMQIVEGTPIPVDHVDVHYTSGHPGVPEPHYHVILWHVSPER